MAWQTVDLVVASFALVAQEGLREVLYSELTDHGVQDCRHLLQSQPRALSLAVDCQHQHIFFREVLQHVASGETAHNDSVRIAVLHVLRVGCVQTLE